MNCDIDFVAMICTIEHELYMIVSMVDKKIRTICHTCFSMLSKLDGIFSANLLFNRKLRQMLGTKLGWGSWILNLMDLDE